MNSLISIFMLISLLLISCEKNEQNIKNFRLPHPDSMGVGTEKFLLGEKQAMSDFSKDKARLFLVGLFRIDSLGFEKMKTEFQKLYRLKIEYKGCTGGDPFINGYNKGIKKLINEKYGIDLNIEIRSWIEKYKKNKIYY